jgi:hypothetical protein
MLRDAVWSKLASAALVGILGGGCSGAVLYAGGILPGLASVEAQLIMLITGSVVFIFMFLWSAWPFLGANRILIEEELPEAYRPQSGAPAQPWRKRTTIRYVETLKATLAASEERLAEFDEIEAYCAWYEDSATRNERRGDHRDSIVQGLRYLNIVRDELSQEAARHEEVVRDIIERLDLIHGGDVRAEVRRIEELREQLGYDRSETASTWTRRLNNLTAQILGCDRDVAELRSLQTERAKPEPASPQQERFQRAASIEDDNERIRVWARHAKFKAYQEQVTMRKQEEGRIRERVMRGELTEREGDELLRKLNKYLSDDDDEIFA